MGPMKGLSPGLRNARYPHHALRPPELLAALPQTHSTSAVCSSIDVLDGSYAISAGTVARTAMGNQAPRVRFISRPEEFAVGLNERESFVQSAVDWVAGLRGGSESASSPRPSHLEDVERFHPRPSSLLK